MTARSACLAALSALLLAGTLGLHPLVWLAWIAPVPLLWLAFSGTRREAAFWTFVAAALGVAVNVPYYVVTSRQIAVAALLVLLQALAWMGIVRRTRTMVLGTNRWFAVFAFPLCWAALDTLISNFSPHSSFGSLAYSQGDFLPVLQFSALAGTPGVVFLLTLFPSVIAIALWRGRRIDRPVLAYGVPAAILAAALGWGAWRIHQPSTGSVVRVGLAAIDDFVGDQAPSALADQVWLGYDRAVQRLAGQGAQLVLLPEKIQSLSAANASARREQLAAVARRDRLYLAVGVGVPDGQVLRNRIWLFDPNGALVTTYDKQHLVPGLEARFTPGDKDEVREIDGIRYGLAICKDLHFPKLGRSYSRLRPAVMLDPAWDFGQDAWMAARLSAVRGIEGGYSIIRASREGLLTVTDRYGRIVAETSSASFPGTALLANVPLAPGSPTLYARVGDLFGWTCLLVVIGWFVYSSRKATTGSMRDALHAGTTEASTPSNPSPQTTAR